MKKVLSYLLGAACVVLACACDPNEHDNVAQLNSFGFKAAQNSALTSDCNATIDGTTIKVVVPAGTDLTALVPSFDVTVNDEVTVGSTLAESGVTACNFSSNPKITVKDAVDGQSVEYTIEFAENDGAAELLSFGFYKDGNSSLEEDAVASEIAEEMIIRIPEGGAGKTLVAKFEAGSGDVVTIDGEEVNGTATVDCSFPIDIVVTDPVAGVSKTYVVKVGKILKMEWNKVIEYTDAEGTLYNDFGFAINPVDNVPYFVYNRAVDGQKRSVVVVKYENGAMATVGTPGFNAALTSDSGIPKIAFDKDGVAYVFYADGDYSKLSTVRKLEGDWNVIGTAGFGSDEKLNTSYGNGMMIDPKTNTPGIVYTANTKNAAGYRTTVGGVFNGTDWNYAAVSGMPAVNGSTAAVMAYSPVATTDDAAYIIASANQSGFQLIKFADKSFSVVSSYLDGHNYASLMGFAADSQKNLYLLGADNEGTDDYNLNLSKYDVANNQWTKMASTIQTKYSATSGSKAALCIDKSDNVYAAYGDADKVLWFGGIDPETKDWGGFTKLDGDNTIKSDILMEFSKDGSVGYLVWLRAKTETAPVTMVVYECKLEADILPE